MMKKEGEEIGEGWTEGGSKRVKGRKEERECYIPLSLP